MKFLNSIKGLLVAAVVGVATLAVSSIPASAQGVIEEIQKRGKLRVGMATFVPWAMRVRCGEIHCQITAWSDRHAADDDIKFFGNQGWDNPTPSGGNKFHFNAHVGGNFFGNIDFKADEVSLLVAHRPRYKCGHSNT